MRTSLTQLFIGTSLFVFVGLGKSPAFAQPAESNRLDQSTKKSDVELVQTLRAAWRRCQSDAEFKANYRYYEGFSSGDVELSEIKKIEHVNVFAAGFVCKQAQRYRLSRIYAGDPVRVGGVAGRRGPQMIQKMDFDEETDGTIFISFKPGQSEVASHAQVMKLEEEGLHIGVMPRPGQLGAISPIHPAGGGGVAGFPLEPHPRFHASDFQVTRLDDNRVRLRAQIAHANPIPDQGEQVSPFRLSSTYTADWNLKHDVPVIERAHIHVEQFGNRAGITETEVRMSEFRDCDGFRLPSQILFLWRGNFRNAGKPVPKVAVRQWSSQDLGQELPESDDFAIPLEPATVLIGLKNPIPVRENGHISVVDLKPDDLLSIGDPAPAGSSPTPNLAIPKPR